ncbi:hypothetical protein SAMN04487898_105130 [Pedobacter sp. ok626]|uniref:hypothetical protein n=1 Tax=Pedobacter sp. ok626 TaxID=1761882 RepID=UPI00088F3296|nr:hypothetical protein [Pedobacter sp. ok626]SDJ94990.1 hypothetical protein SAMN04487898_105130 [Pedobacter sp. ok626]
MRKHIPILEYLNEIGAKEINYKQRKITAIDGDGKNITTIYLAKSVLSSFKLSDILKKDLKEGDVCYHILEDEDKSIWLYPLLMGTTL